MLFRQCLQRLCADFSELMRQKTSTAPRRTQVMTSRIRGDRGWGKRSVQTSHESIEKGRQLEWETMELLKKLCDDRAKFADADATNSRRTMSQIADGILF